MCEISLFQREGEEGWRQEGVAAKIHGHDPVIPILHKVDTFQVRYAEAQPAISELVMKANTPFPSRDGENL